MSDYKIKFSLLSLVALLSLAGCNERGKFDELNTYLKEARAKAASQPALKAQSMSASKVSYSAQHLPSPFSDQAGPNMQTLARPLTRFDLTALKVIGTLLDTDKQYAFISASDGKIYRVTQGDVVGRQQQKVISVDRDGITLTDSLRLNVAR